MGINEIRKLKAEAGKTKEKKWNRIAPKSEKTLAAEQRQRDQGTDKAKDEFFNSQRKYMKAVCACGCGKPSQKDHDVYFRFCICHVFPQRLFPSIQFHPANWVERAFWGGDHADMDNRSMDKWPAFADWEQIKEKFHLLAPLLTDQERKKKFYTHLESLVYKF